MSATPFALALAILSGTQWVTSGPIEQSISFDEGKLSAYTGCNQAFGDYTESGNTLSLNLIGMTKMACAEEARANAELNWLEQTGKVKAFKVENGDLVLLDGSGQTVMTLKSK